MSEDDDFDGGKRERERRERDVMSGGGTERILEMDFTVHLKR